MVTRTYYEGQMPLEEEVIQGGSVQSLTRNFLGGRGLEAITTTDNSVTTTAYPLYDTHGNMVATLTKNASGTSWNVGNERTYDVWGGVRSGAATGGPKGRYCANLGHVQDDESGLIYMRARYYEPSTGRFISEDPAYFGRNWYAYCTNTPTNRVDPTGKLDGKVGPESIIAALAEAVLLAFQRLGIEPDRKLHAIILATAETAKALSMMEASLGLAICAKTLAPLAAAATVIGAAAGQPLPGLILFSTIYGLGALSAALAVAALVTIINASYMVAILVFTDESL